VIVAAAGALYLWTLLSAIGVAPLGQGFASAYAYEYQYDETPPDCELTRTGTDPSGNRFAEATVQDTESGLASIVVTKSENATTVVPPFTPGTREPVVVRSTKINDRKRSAFELRVTDMAGNTRLCDPILALEIREAGQPASTSFSGIPQAESKISIENGDPGVNRLDVDVNGSIYKLTGLDANEVRTLDVASAMQPGDDNTITLTAHGRPGGTVFVVISD
jgi:hypothetical protein